MNYHDGRSVTSRSPSETSHSATYTQAGPSSQGDPWYRNDPWLGSQAGQFVPILPEGRQPEPASWDNWMGEFLRTQTDRVQNVIPPMVSEPPHDIPEQTLMSAMIPEWINLPQLTHVQGIPVTASEPTVLQTASLPLNRTDYQNVEPFHEALIKDSLVSLRRVPVGTPSVAFTNSTDEQVVDDFHKVTTHLASH